MSAHGKKNDGTGVDIGKLVSSMKRELDYYWSLGEESDTPYSTCLIYKVQQHISEVDRSSYEPIMLSIGPYHHGAVACQTMEKTKWGYLDEIIKLSCRRNLLDYLNEIWVLCSPARRCYSDHFEMDNEEFLQMLLLDGCWILVALGATERLTARVQLSERSGNGQDRAVDTAEAMLGTQEEESVIENADYIQESNQDTEMEDPQSSQQVGLWFNSFGRRYLKLGQHHNYNDQSGNSTQQVEYLEAGQQLNRWRRVAQYLETGVQFRKRDFDKLDPHSLLDIRFTNSALEVPCLVIDEHTEFLFRNLIAFEQTCPQVGDDFTAYSVFLSQLISMPEDVTLLAKKGILVHHLDSDETVSDLLTKLHIGVVFDFNGNNYLKSVCQTMEAHYQNRLNRWMTWLWFNHFSNPWLVLAALATVVALVCTIVQTVYGILAYLYPPGPSNS